MRKVKVESEHAGEDKKTPRPQIPDKVLRRLWVNSGGRCQYDGCNSNLLEHALTRRKFNQAYVAHIVAFEPEGPRGDEVLSPELAKEYDNLMLLCDGCHRLVDKEDIEGHPVARLTEMKRKHESRIQLVTSIRPERSTQIVLYGANIGAHTAPLSYTEAATAAMPDMFPAQSQALELSLGNCAFHDHEQEYWRFQEENLSRLFQEKVVPAISAGSHFSVFALAPMPLLIKLGTLIADITRVDVYQRQREPQTWKWLSDSSAVTYRLDVPEDCTGAPVLIIALSATVTPDRIAAVLKEKHSVWRITIDKPNNDCIKAKVDLAGFRQIMREAFDTIKAAHGQQTPLRIFPAMPVSTAVELGRVRMPKADMPIIVFDQNKHTNSFIQTITIR